MSHSRFQRHGAWASLFLASACSGSVGGGGGGDNGGGGGGGSDVTPVDPDEPLPVPAKNSLERNPANTLVCANPKGMNIGTTPLSRLTNAEYHNTIADLIAPLTLTTRPALPLEVLTEGFSNNWAGQQAGAPYVEQLELGAQAVGTLVAKGIGQMGAPGCPPANMAAEAACLDGMLDTFAMRAFRRPLASDERDRLKTLFGKARTWGFERAIDLTVQAIVESPQFLYKVELGGDEQDGALALTGYEVATRLSYLLWDSMPDPALFAAAKDGSLDTLAGIDAQVTRMLADPRAEGALREFDSQWLSLPRMAGNASPERKSRTLFASYDQKAADAVMGGLESFMTDALLGEGGGLRRLLTSTKVFVNSSSAAIYGATAPSGATLAPVDITDGSRTGLLTQAGLMAGFAHDTTQAPVFRGVFVLDQMLCQKPPPPPNNVSVTPPPADPSVRRTSRERLVEEHEKQGAGCQSCHEVIDGAGFAFEHYGAIGQWQDFEDGDLPIDSSARLLNTYDADGEFASVIEMAEALSKSEQVAQCFVTQFYRYALARSQEETDGCNIAAITDQVVASDGDFRALVSALTKTHAFRFRTPFVQ